MFIESEKFLQFVDIFTDLESEKFLQFWEVPTDLKSCQSLKSSYSL